MDAITLMGLSVGGLDGPFPLMFDGTLKNLVHGEALPYANAHGFASIVLWLRLLLAFIEVLGTGLSLQQLP
jgi:hypothetical protein